MALVHFNREPINGARMTQKNANLRMFAPVTLKSLAPQLIQGAPADIRQSVFSVLSVYY